MAVSSGVMDVTTNSSKKEFRIAKHNIKTKKSLVLEFSDEISVNIGISKDMARENEKE